MKKLIKNKKSTNKQINNQTPLDKEQTNKQIITNNQMQYIREYQPMEKYPTVHLPLNLTKEIILYLNNSEIFDCMTLNKNINTYLKNRIHYTKPAFKKEIELRGHDNMNETYCEIELSDYVKEECLKKVDFTILTKDQGWASVNESSSWVEIKFINNEDEKTFVVTRNFKERDYKTIKIEYNYSSNGIESEIFELFKDRRNKVKIVARSMYPGWVCHIKKVLFIFTNFELNRN